MKKQKEVNFIFKAKIKRNWMTSEKRKGTFVIP